MEKRARVAVGLLVAAAAVTLLSRLALWQVPWPLVLVCSGLAGLGGLWLILPWVARLLMEHGHDA